MKPTLDVEDIRALMPHRFPMLLVDRILELDAGKRVVGLKNVTINEPFFLGHFPGQAIMPGVLIIEAMAQVAGLMLLSLPDHEGKLVLLAGIEKSRFRQRVGPGDTLITEAQIMWLRGMMGRAKMVARVDGVVAASCEMTFALVDPVVPDQVHAKLEAMSRDYSTNGASHAASGDVTGVQPIKEESADRGGGDRE